MDFEKKRWNSISSKRFPEAFSSGEAAKTLNFTSVILLCHVQEQKMYCETLLTEFFSFFFFFKDNILRENGRKTTEIHSRTQDDSACFLRPLQYTSSAIKVALTQKSPIRGHNKAGPR